MRVLMSSTRPSASVAAARAPFGLRATDTISLRGSDRLNDMGSGTPGCSMAEEEEEEEADEAAGSSRPALLPPAGDAEEAEDDDEDEEVVVEVVAAVDAFVLALEAADEDPQNDETIETTALLKLVATCVARFVTERKGRSTPAVEYTPSMGWCPAIMYVNAGSSTSPDLEGETRWS